LEGTEDFYCESFAEQKVAERFFLEDGNLGNLPPNGTVEISYQPSFVGKISHLPAFAILPYGGDFVRVYTIIARDGNGKYFPTNSVHLAHSLQNYRQVPLALGCCQKITNGLATTDKTGLMTYHSATTITPSKEQYECLGR
jgi:hypothetical protein